MLCLIRALYSVVIGLKMMKALSVKLRLSTDNPIATFVTNSSCASTVLELVAYSQSFHSCYHGLSSRWHA